jgi:hypothetical protein
MSPKGVLRVKIYSKTAEIAQEKGYDVMGD